MNRIFISNSLFPKSIRAYNVVAAERSCTTEASSTPIKLAAEAILGSAAQEKEDTNYWMRDPKTGNWMPENRISKVEVDPAMLRAKFLPSKK
ncbi:hypothetical protein IEQ34_017196 [Dendrobium chrysotoxum]|uniref:Late embryogenesis abundant protein n=1 Tax=Dendrobium chrysotoxum TaxID=161865 RepID=A0AAV7GAQ0_DENCH|nr:hypothetical protein IEQ34_017196 [Dendrobium chrysotoxum]